MKRIGGASGAAVVASIAAGLVVGSFATSAAAQDKPAGGPGFGDRSHGIFGVENVFGFTETKETRQDSRGRDTSSTYDDKGFLPGYFGPRLGLHGVSNHVTYGVVFGAWYTKLIGPDALGGGSDPAWLFLFSVGPRIGYAGSLPKQPVIGYWVRTGPSFYYAHAESTSSSGRTSTVNAGNFAWAIEAFGVITPAEHFGIFVGPSFDVAIYGKSSDRDDKLGVISLGIGLLADW